MNFLRKKWEEFWKTVDEFVPEDADVSCRSCYACPMCYQSGENVTWNGNEYENWDYGLKCDFSRRLMGENDGSNSPFCLDARSKNGECGVEGRNFIPIASRKSKNWFSKFGPWNFNSTRYVLSRTSSCRKSLDAIISLENDNCDYLDDFGKTTRE
jgi:hypothetical protein